MRILVTGGAGFIGSHLCERLLQLGHSVVAVDNLSTGSAENVSTLRQHRSFTLHIDSIFTRGLMADLVDAADAVLHLAAAVGVRNIVDAPVHTIETNVRGCELVLELAAKKRKRVLLASTSEVYGKSTRLPFRETDDLVLGPTFNSRWSYACSKAIDEFLALAYFRERRLPVTIVRLFNIAGPRQTGRYGMVLPVFTRQALLGEPVTVFGDGEQTRCFCHVDDAVNGLVAVMDRQDTAGEIFNLGSSDEISMNALARRVLARTASRSPLHHIPYSQAYGPGFEDMQRRVPDLTKAREWFGYQPTRNLDQIVDDVVAFTRAQLPAESAMGRAPAVTSGPHLRP